ncbi:DUF305 domain-containing protein [Streptomyces sp. NBC_00178]|uniref:DUF305 domain-containing protein n=1 Tax=Streptomyces sp. NBC_00178 TaxID=2975672 RepID=UPI002E2A3A18|nr:DUF305 domain-containing protein [Streptomyces sp. NBC_00178]
MAARRTAAALLLLVLLTSCTGNAGPEPGHGAGPPPTTAAPAPSGHPTDAAWVQLMVPMDEQAVVLLGLAAREATGPGLRPWAARLRAELASELGDLRRLRDRMGLPDTDLHKGHDMPGMVTDQDLDDARAARGSAFDSLLVAQMHDHLRQSAQVSRSEVTAGTRAEARERAGTLVTARGGQLAALAALCAGTPTDVPEPFACPSDHPV